MCTNSLQMPAKDAHLQLQKWANEYGYEAEQSGDSERLLLNSGSPVYSLMLGTKPTIIFSSDLAIKDLLDKKGNIYSDRPDMYISQGVASGGHRLVVMVSEVLLRHYWSRYDCSCLQKAGRCLL